MRWRGKKRSVLWLLALLLLPLLIILAMALSAYAETMPPLANTYAPILAQRQAALWADAPTPWTLAGLVEQESCISLKHSKCWNPKAELKTYREYGFGLGQITIAYNSNGTERFNIFNEVKSKYASLNDWRWEDRFDPERQLTAIVEEQHTLWKKVPPAASSDDHWAFSLVSYNGGIGALLQDRRYCANSSGCDPTVWFNNIETHSLKSKVPQKAYGGQSWYSISRGYVKNVLTIRRSKYQKFWSS